LILATKVKKGRGLKERTKCLEEVKTKGNSPIVLHLIIKINRDKKINNEPGIISLPKLLLILQGDLLEVA
jgi:hypothetical protein